MAVIVVLAGFTTIYPDAVEAQAWVKDLGFWMNLARPYAAGLLALAGIVLFVIRATRAKTMAEARLGWPLLLIGAAVALVAVPAPIAASLRFWAGALTAGVGWFMNYLVAPYLGDVVRYVRATPQTVGKRRDVRERGLALLEAIHAKRLKSGGEMADFTQASTKETPLYDRIVVVGHSLGSMVAYDLLQLFWEKHGPTHHQEWIAGNAEVQQALAEVDAFVQRAWATWPPTPIDQAAFAAAQQKLFGLLRDERPHWRISDLITLGSPLAHAEFLLADSERDVRQAFEERRFATSPPHPEPTSGGSMLFRGRGPSGALYPHFATQFAAVRWTNIHDESENPLFGDVFAGPLAPVFGPGITDFDDEVRRAALPGALGRVFTHTSYWDWAPTGPMPDHIVHLCAALRLGT